MKLKCVKNGATDRYTKERYIEGIEYDFEESRAEELLKTKYFEAEETKDTISVDVKKIEDNTRQQFGAKKELGLGEEPKKKSKK